MAVHEIYALVNGLLPFAVFTWLRKATDAFLGVVVKVFTLLGKFRFFLAVLGAAWSVLPGSGYAGSMSSTHPDHYFRPPSPSESLFNLPRVRTKQPAKTSNVILQQASPLRDEWSVSGLLSDACRRGEFRQRREHHLVAILDGRTYGAAVGGHHSLVDRGALAKKSVIYLFKAQGTSTCRVYHRSR